MCIALPAEASTDWIVPFCHLLPFNGFPEVLSRKTPLAHRPAGLPLPLPTAQVSSTWDLPEALSRIFHKPLHFGLVPTPTETHFFHLPGL